MICYIACYVFPDGPRPPAASICLPAQTHAETHQVPASSQGDYDDVDQDDYPATKLEEFLEKCQREGGQSKDLYCRFWELKSGLFEHENDKKKSNFRVQGMFFLTIVLYYSCITPISVNHMHAFHNIQPSYIPAYMQSYLS